MIPIRLESFTYLVLETVAEPSEHACLKAGFYLSLLPMSASKVTVLMTVYNGMPYLTKSVESVLGQSLIDFEFVIVDDGSTDGTADYLASLDDDRVKVISQENGGTADAANHGLQHVTTEFVARMDADDISMSNRLELQLDYMLANPEVGILGSQVAPAGEQSIGKSLNLPESHKDIFDALMSGHHGLAHSSLMIRTKTLKEVGGYWKFPLIDDWDMMLRMGEVSKLANLSNIMLLYRVHSGSLNGQSMLRMYQSIGYAIERAKRRQSDREQISYEEFLKFKDSQAMWVRLPEKLHVVAMTQYRLAVAEIFSGRKLKGYSRLALSSVLSPSRTLHRLGRIARGRPRSLEGSAGTEIDSNVASHA